jgi:hypothetical protein
VAATLLLALAVSAICLRNAAAWIGRPFAGFLFLENGVVVSVGRTEWAPARHRSVPFARILAVDGQPVTSGHEVHAYVSRVGVGRPVTFTFRKGTEIFRLTLEVRQFGVGDFVGLFVPMLGVGLLMVLVSGAVVARRPDLPAARGLFAFCLSVGLTLITSPDEYAPYRFTRLFFLSLAAIPATALHNALTFPQPRWAFTRWPALWVALYLPFVALGVGLHWAMPQPSLFLPLLYCVYLLTANAGVVYVGGLVLALIDGARPRKPIVLALVAVLGSALLAASVLVAYPLLQRPIPPSWLVSPLPLIPVLLGLVLLRFDPPVVPAVGRVGVRP